VRLDWLAHPDGILLNRTSIENAHKVRRKTADLLLSTEDQQTLSFPFTQLRHYQMDVSMLKTAVFEFV